MEVETAWKGIGAIDRGRGSESNVATGVRGKATSGVGAWSAAPGQTGTVSFFIRPALPHEHDEIGALTAEGYRADGLLGRPDGSEDHYEPELRDAAGRATRAEVLVAVDDDGTLLGTITWCPPGSALRELAVTDAQGEFRMLSVGLGSRRQGVARALVEACLSRARAAGLREIVLCSLPQMTKAHALYASVGFVRAPDLDWEPVPVIDLWGFRLML